MKGTPLKGAILQARERKLTILLYTCSLLLFVKHACTVQKDIWICLVGEINGSLLYFSFSQYYCWYDHILHDRLCSR